ncbi:hypothetical protein FD03_GL001824 [Companilactobacillus nodensis DSM 19682 = JCM 14932 = NBRC 107160]|uniref:Uncharacterized protein n=2 Tax=Companilactobacillus nodensis TaxID=460870 RepID=A0A0R1KHH0_9LACO|nr:hypothetical protein FD03_GL001824 [Companilactobacillus nodensis DSM 19682 = JCM 14932 = NBRC 107160]
MIKMVKRSIIWPILWIFLILDCSVKATLLLQYDNGLFSDNLRKYKLLLILGTVLVNIFTVFISALGSYLVIIFMNNSKKDLDIGKKLIYFIYILNFTVLNLIYIIYISLNHSNLGNKYINVLSIIFGISISLSIYIVFKHYSLYNRILFKYVVVILIINEITPLYTIIIF